MEGELYLHDSQVELDWRRILLITIDKAYSIQQIWAVLGQLGTFEA